MNTLFKLLMSLFGLNRIASGKFTIVGSLQKPLHVNIGFRPKEISITILPHHGYEACAHDHDWFSWEPTHEGFVFRAKLVSEHREVFWTASR